MYWKEDEISVLKKNFFNKSYKELSFIIDRSEGSVRGKSERLGLKKKENKIWTEKEENFILKNYGIVPPIRIASYLNRSVSSISLKAFYLGVTNKYDYKYVTPSYNENFFNVWSKELVWLVGIVLSDGHVSNSKLKSRYIQIKMCDKDVIYKIKEIIRYNKETYEYNPKNGCKISYTITVGGRHIWNFFTNLGMDSNKSHNAIFPDSVPKRFVSHLIRGVFDGDGSITINKGKYLSCRICGTEKLINSINKHINLYSTIHSNREKTNFIVQYTGKNALSFLDFIYKDSEESNRMDRKYNKYLLFKSKV